MRTQQNSRLPGREFSAVLIDVALQPVKERSIILKTEYSFEEVEGSTLFIRNCLTKRDALNIIHPDETIATVLKKMEKHLSLPCATANHEFLGLISKRTIFDAFLTAHQEGILFDEFAKESCEVCINREVSTLTLRNHFEETIEIITRQPFVPIVEGDVLLGIVKRSDVQRSLAIAFATNIHADRLLLGVAEAEGALQRLFTVTHRLGINVVTCVALDAEESALNRRVILKVEKTQKLDQLIQQLERAGYLIISVN